MNGNPFENVAGRLAAAEMARANHKPGRVIRFKSGATYVVLPSGAWKRTSGKHGRDLYGRKVAK